jgi:hypothetical protein
MSSNDNDKTIHTAASVQRSRWGVTLAVCTATGAETPLNNPNRPSTRASKKLSFHVDVATAKVTTTTCRNKATPALEHPATVDGTARQWQAWGLHTKIVTKFMSYALQTPRLQKPESLRIV